MVNLTGIIFPFYYEHSTSFRCKNTIIPYIYRSDRCEFAAAAAVTQATIL